MGAGYQGCRHSAGMIERENTMTNHAAAALVHDVDTHRRAAAVDWAMCLYALSLAVALTAPVQGQPYPNKPIRIVASAPGGGNDLASRILAQGLTENLGQQ